MRGECPHHTIEQFVKELKLFEKKIPIMLQCCLENLGVVVNVNVPKTVGKLHGGDGETIHRRAKFTSSW